MPRLPRIGDADGRAPGSVGAVPAADDWEVLRKVLLSAVVVSATLVVAPNVLGAVSGQSIHERPFTEARPATHGRQSAPALGSGRLRIGVPVRSTLTIANDGSSAARYLLSARVGGDRLFAWHLRVIVTRRTDHAVVFSGPVTRLQTADLGTFRARATETFDVSVTLLPTGSTAGDNALQGRSASVDFGWTAASA